MAASPSGRAFVRRWDTGADLDLRITEAEAAVACGVAVPLAAHQVDALVSFVLDVGPDRFARSTLRRLADRGDLAAIPDELRRWVRVRRGAELVDDPAAVARRGAEADLFRGAVESALSRPTSERYAFAQNPAAVAVIAGIEVADAAQIGLGAAAMVQSAVSASSERFVLTYPQWQRMLTHEARRQMPGASAPMQQYQRRLFQLATGRPGTARADVTVTWAGNAFGEIETPVIQRDLDTSTDWTHSDCAITIVNVFHVPENGTDPRTWPIHYSYTGFFDPVGNGKFEFQGEFALDAFGGLQFVKKHHVVSRSQIDWAVMGKPEDYVAAGPAVAPVVTAVPADQLEYLRTHLP